MEELEELEGSSGKERSVGIGAAVTICVETGTMARSTLMWSRQAQEEEAVVKKLEACQLDLGIDVGA